MMNPLQDLKRLLVTFVVSFLFVTPVQASFIYIPVKPPQVVRGVTLVVHGLNLKPLKMSELAEELNLMNRDVVLVTLAGHGEDEKEFGKVTREGWLSDLYEAYKEASSKAAIQNVPVQFLGFSVGGLLGVDLLASRKVQFAKMVLLAPAIRVHARSRVRRFARFFKMR